VPVPAKYSTSSSLSWYSSAPIRTVAGQRTRAAPRRRHRVHEAQSAAAERWRDMSGRPGRRVRKDQPLAGPHEHRRPVLRQIRSDGASSSSPLANGRPPVRTVRPALLRTTSLRSGASASNARSGGPLAEPGSATRLPHRFCERSDRSIIDRQHGNRDSSQSRQLRSAPHP
jgi:hypothetical protein